MASWLNGFLDVSLIKPDGTPITPANAAANGVEITTPPDAPDGRMTSFAVTPVSGSLISNGAWKVRLGNVAADSYFALTFAADPPAPSVSWLNPLLPGVAPDGSGHLNLQWNANRAGAVLADDVFAELFYAPVIQPVTFPSLFVSFPGSYQAAAGLGANWDPGASAITAEDNNHDGVWKLATSSIPAGNYEYKVALNGNWLVNYGLGGIRDGEDITMTQPTTNAPLSFYFDSTDKFITTRPHSDIIVLVGDMLSEIGGADWDPANLLGWLKPTEDADQFELTLHLPEGNWAYKVALNESWALNYGAGGAANGPNIPLVVPDGGAAGALYLSHRHAPDRAHHFGGNQRRSGRGAAKSQPGGVQLGYQRPGLRRVPGRDAHRGQPEIERKRAVLGARHGRDPRHDSAACAGQSQPAEVQRWAGGALAAR